MNMALPTFNHRCLRKLWFEIGPQSAWRSDLPINLESRIQLSGSRGQGLKVFLSDKIMQKEPIFLASWKWHFSPSSMAEKIMIRDRPAIRMTQRASNRSGVTDSAIWVSRTGPQGPFIQQNHAKSTHFSQVLKMTLQLIIAVRETLKSRLPPIPLDAAGI